MMQLIKTEWLKLKKYPAFWVLFGIVALSYPSVNYMFHLIYKDITHSKGMSGEMMKMLLENPFSFPEAWHTVGFFSSIFIFIPAILVIMLIANEYTYKTHRQNIIDGWSRKEFITSKLLSVVIVAFLATLVYSIIATVFGIAYSSEFSLPRWAEQIKYIPLFFLQTFAQLSIAFLIGFLVKRSFIALAIFFFYFFMVENILVNLVKYKTIFPNLSHYFPLEISDKLIPMPIFMSKFNAAKYNQDIADIPYFALYSCLLTALVWFVCYKLYERKDL